MDFAAFGEDTFDVKQWVNQTLDQKVEGDSIDTHISTAVMKLQLRAQVRLCCNHSKHVLFRSGL